MKDDTCQWPDRRQFIRKGAAVGASVGVALAVKGALKPPPAAAQGVRSSIRWGFLVDLNRCVGCHACSVACKTENDIRLGAFRNSVKYYESAAGRSFLPWLCNHCANPPCIPVCPVDPVPANFRMPDGSLIPYEKRATFQRPDGLVLIDQDRCVGCGKCVQACPYRVRYLDPVLPAGGAPGNMAADKCTLCEHRLRNGQTPACVDTCLAKARVAGDLNDPNSEISQRLATTAVQVLLPSAGTEPQCYYAALNPDAYLNGRDTRDEMESQ